jgi:predicted esterase
MRRFCRWISIRAIFVGAFLIGATWNWHGIVNAAKLVMKDGRSIEGTIAKLGSIVQGGPGVDHKGGGGDLELLLLVDDKLRRTFVGKRQTQEALEAPDGAPQEKVNIRQPVATTGFRIVKMGPFARVTEFDEFGRRIVEMPSAGAVLAIVQGITLITPTYTKVEAVRVDGKNYVWDMRIATTSIPAETLHKILHKHVRDSVSNLDPKKPDDAEKILSARLIIVRLYIQMERFKEAQEELGEMGAEAQAMLVRLPDDKKGQFEQILKAEQQALAQVLKQVRQSQARRILAEAQARRKASQHALTLAMLEKFPAEGVAGETLQAVQQMQDEYKATFERGKTLLARFDVLMADSKIDPAHQKLLEPIRAEINRELNINTLGRLAAFEQFHEAPDMGPDAKLALAVSGWLVGVNDVTRNLPTAISLFETRNMVRQYLTEPLVLNRETILGRMQSQEGATPEMIARIIAHMRPPQEPTEFPKEVPGLFTFEAEGIKGQPPVTYYVQLPPEYDSYRRYPTVVTLHGAGSTPHQQIDWWAGTLAANGTRLGQGTRQGYIVIAPLWAKEQQKTYGYSAEEHAAVLNSLRDASRRFSIDTDRVFLSGHSIGGDAAWDIGLSHPDLWAGVIPIVAQADKFVGQYWDNAKYVNLYVVGGELDGDKVVKNSRELDRYLQRGFNATVVEYQGRGHEHFSDEIIRLFDWMGRYRRDFFNKDFNVRTMRSWDNYFWWVEMDSFPEKGIVSPENWPPKGNARALQTDATINAGNGITVRTAANDVTLWLSPELIDFKKKSNISVNGRSLRMAQPYLEPSSKVILEDVRTRSDRLHPFWVKIEMPANRINMANR